MDAHELVARVLDIENGMSKLEPANRRDQVTFDGRILRTVHGPKWRLLIIGAGQLSRYSRRSRRTLDYEVIVCDPREEYNTEWNVPDTPCSRACPTTWCSNSISTHIAPWSPSPTTRSWTTWR